MREGQFRDLVDSLLTQGLGELSMTLAVVARIENDKYEIVAVQSNSGAYVPGEIYDLGNSYSRDVFEGQQIIAENNIPGSPQNRHHPLYRSLPLEAYLGAPITIDGQPWGCLEFSSIAHRDKNFSQSNVEMINKLAGKISQMLSTVE